jgi:hypothetical protein
MPLNTAKPGYLALFFLCPTAQQFSEVAIAVNLKMIAPVNASSLSILGNIARVLPAVQFLHNTLASSM